MTGRRSRRRIDVDAVVPVPSTGPRTDADAELQARYANYVANQGVNRSASPTEAEIDDQIDEVLLERARAEAAQEATVTLPRQRQEQAVKKGLKGIKKKSLDKAKEKVQMARKPRMRTVQQFLCDECDRIIPRPTDGNIEGYVVKGNIYVADPNERGGMIGDNFPDVQPGEKIDPEQVRETVLCKMCFLKALGMGGVNLRYRGSEKATPKRNGPNRDLSEQIGTMLAQDNPLGRNASGWRRRSATIDEAYARDARGERPEPPRDDQEDMLDAEFLRQLERMNDETQGYTA